MIPAIYTNLNDPAVRQLFTEFQYSAWQLKTLQTYHLDHENSAYEQFIRHDRVGPIAKAMQSWITTVVTPAVKAGKYIGRVHIAEVNRSAQVERDRMSDYMRYEREAYRYCAAKGEDIRIIETTPGTWPPDVFGPGHDFWLFDYETLMEMHYTPDGSFRQAVIYTEYTYPAALARAAKCREVAQMTSIPFKEWH